MLRDEHRFPGPEDLPSKGAFSSTFHLTVGAASNELSLTEEPDALPGMAIPCASYRHVTGRFRFAPSAIPRACDVRSRSPFTHRGNRSFPCTLLWTSGHRSLCNAVAESGCLSTSATNCQT